MNQMLIATVAVFALLPVRLSSAKPQDETEIPLSKIYAIGMPGTVNLWKTDDKIAWKEVASVGRAIAEPDPKGNDANPGFIVLGTGLQALDEVKSVLVDGKKPRETLPKGSEASVIFFSHRFPQYVHLVSVSQAEHQITIRFKFVPHATKDLTTHFALIPLGNCSPGKIRVEIVQLPTDKAFIDEGLKPVSNEIRQKTVCHSFTFECEGDGKSKSMP